MKHIIIRKLSDLQKILIFPIKKFEFINITEEDEISFDTINYCYSEMKAFFIDEQTIKKICIGEKTAGLLFEEFMKDYKPLVHRVIPKKVAIKWLKQTMKVYRGFFSSEENYLNMCKELGW